MLILEFVVCIVFPGSKSTVCCLWASRPHQHRKISKIKQKLYQIISWLNNPEWPSLIRTLETTTKSNHGSVIDSCCTNCSMMFHAIPCRDVSSISLWQGLSMATSTWGDNPMISNDIQWYPMISNDIQWYPMISNDIQWYPMISNDIQWSQIQAVPALGSLGHSPNLVWMWHPKASHVHRLAGLCQAVSGCVCLPLCVAHWLTAAILGVPWVKIEVSICQHQQPQQVWRILTLNVARTGRLTHSHLGSKLHNQQYFRSLVSFYILLHIHEISRVCVFFHARVLLANNKL